MSQIDANYFLRQKLQNQSKTLKIRRLRVVGPQGVEPRSAVPETDKNVYSTMKIFSTDQF